MDHKTELEEMMAGRETMYNFLARLYKVEIDDSLLSALKTMDLPEGDDAAGKGWSLMKGWLADPKCDNPVEELAVDYAHTFLSAGIAEGKAAYPFESVYTSPGRLVMQDAWEEVCRIYREHGLARSEGSDTLEDQLGLECEFMAVLTRKALEAIRADDEAALEANLLEQKAFCEKHLANWVSPFCKDLDKYALTDFYRGAGLLTEAFILQDAELLAGLVH